VPAAPGAYVAVVKEDERTAGAATCGRRRTAPRAPILLSSGRGRERRFSSSYFAPPSPFPVSDAFSFFVLLACGDGKRKREARCATAVPLLSE
jgi:hypothetical protein